MKRLIGVVTIITLCIDMVSAQDLTDPDNPHNKFSETKGYITINEFTGGFGLGDTGDPYSKSFFGLTYGGRYKIQETIPSVHPL